MFTCFLTADSFRRFNEFMRAFSNKDQRYYQKLKEDVGDEVVEMFEEATKFKRAETPQRVAILRKLRVLSCSEQLSGRVRKFQRCYNLALIL